MEKISESVLTFLINASWQIAAIACVAAAASALMRRVPAGYRHAIWVAALLSSVLLPLMSVATRTPSVSLPERTASLPTTVPPVLTPAQPVNSTARVSHPVSFDMPVGTAIVALHACLVLLGLARLGRALNRSREIRAGAQAGLDSPELWRTWQRCLDAFGARRVDLLTSPAVPSPVALGVFRPAVVLPDDFSSGQSEEVLTAAMGHELAHVSRRDTATNLLYEFLRVFISFHPATWWILRQIEQTREMACDEAVTRRLQEPRVYARSILHIATTITSQAQPGYTLGIFDGSILEERMRRILRGSFTSLRRSRILFATSISTLIAGAIIASSVALTARAQSGIEEQMKQGIAAYNASDFAAAARHFTSAVSMEPANESARLYLANTLLREYYRSGSQPDSRLITAAGQQYTDVLARNPNSRQALAGMSTIAFELKRFPEAKQWTEKLAAVDPNDKSAFYTLGVLEWVMVFPAYQQAKQATGAPPQDYSIPDPAVRKTLRDQHLDSVERGMQMLRKALVLDPEYHDAMAYLNLLYRLKASMVDSPEEARIQLAEADRWVGQALEMKRKVKSGEPGQEAKLSLDGPPPGPASRASMAKAPPPPPPPPPPGPNQSKQIASDLPRPAAEPNQPPIMGQFWQVVGSTDMPAIDLFRQLQGKGFESRLYLGSDKQVRVVVGPFFDDSLAVKAKGSLETAGFRVLRKWN